MKPLTTAEAAARLGVSIRRVQQLVKTGRLPAEEFGGSLMIQEKDLALVEDRPAGRPPKAPAETTAQLNKAFREAKEAEEAGQKKVAKKESKK